MCLLQWPGYQEHLRKPAVQFLVQWCSGTGIASTASCGRISSSQSVSLCEPGRFTHPYANSISFCKPEFIVKVAQAWEGARVQHAPFLNQPPSWTWSTLSPHSHHHPFFPPLSPCGGTAWVALPFQVGISSPSDCRPCCSLLVVVAWALA